MMNGAHLHLMINHFPVIGLLFGVVILAVAQLRRNSDLARTGLVALVVIAILTIPAYLTGEPAHDIVHDLAGISEEIRSRPRRDCGDHRALWPRGVPSTKEATWLVRPDVAHPLLHLRRMAGVYFGGGQISHEEARPGFQIVGE